LGPQNVTLTAEIADGWLPYLFSPRHYQTVYQPQLEEGFAKAGNGKSTANFDIAPTVPVALGDDLEVCRNMVRPFIALYIGGMGAKGKNFYYDIVCRYGYEAAATQIQDAYLSGNKAEATSAVPDALIDEIALCGPKARIRDLLAEWKASPITTLNITAFDVDTLRTMAELVMA
jgi:alkanesulfonate monooxygenase SsuD/methylene tetrahydromethanopterin reductase-like flavin-dependent oxidoreductase (luciferase family)